MDKATIKTLNEQVMNLNLDLLGIIQDYERETGFTVNKIELTHTETETKKKKTIYLSARVAIIY